MSKTNPLWCKVCKAIKEFSRKGFCPTCNTYKHSAWVKGNMESEVGIKFSWFDIQDTRKEFDKMLSLKPKKDKPKYCNPQQLELPFPTGPDKK